jgi:hypothetical protein
LVHQRLGYFGDHARVVGDLARGLVRLAEKDNLYGRALREGLAPLTASHSVSQRRDVFERYLATALDALDLSLTPDDLTTEGGLRAAIKIAEPSVTSARVAWQNEFASWAECHSRAHSARKRVLRDRAAAAACSETAQQTAPGGNEDEWQSVLDWQSRAHRYQICLESNPAKRISAARYQAQPCASGRALRRSAQ